MRQGPLEPYEYVEITCADLEHEVALDEAALKAKKARVNEMTNWLYGKGDRRRYDAECAAYNEKHYPHEEPKPQRPDNSYQQWKDLKREMA